MKEEPGGVELLCSPYETEAGFGMHVSAATHSDSFSLVMTVRTFAEHPADTRGRIGEDELNALSPRVREVLLAMAEAHGMRLTVPEDLHAVFVAVGEKEETGPGESAKEESKE